LTSLLHYTWYIVNRIPKEQGKGIIQKTTESKDKVKLRQHTRKRQKGGVQKTKKTTEHRGETNSHKRDDTKTEALTDFPCSRGVVHGELNSLRIVAHAKDDCWCNILVISSII
jgi:hypothetical protein